MKKNFKKIISTTMALTMVSITLTTATANAFDGIKTSNSYEKNYSPLLHDFISQNNSLEENSPRLMLGPVKNFTQKGSVVKRSTYQNIATTAVAAAFVAKITGIPTDLVYTNYGKLTLALAALGKGDKYYTRTQYVSKTGEMYYYEYKYYSDSSYKKHIGTSYSYVYSKWARNN